MSQLEECSEELTDAERQRVEKNREHALELLSSQVVANDRDVYASVKRMKTSHAQLMSDGGFLPEDDEKTNHPDYEKDEEFSDEDEKRPVRRKRKINSGTSSQITRINQPYEKDDLPLPPDEDKPRCDTCSKEFEDSYLKRNFDVYVCDRCRDPKGIHTLITKSTAKDRYLLSDTDLDVREPKLRFVLKRNPQNSSWSDMRLYLEAQVAERALAVWGSEESLEEERTRRLNRTEAIKLRRYNKKLKELKVQTRSSLYMKTHKAHEHVYGPEEYDEENEVYFKQCTECNYKNTFEKL